MSGELIISDKLDVKIRWMLARDAEAASDIEDYNFTGYTIWDFKKFIKQDDTISLVAEYCGAVVGFILCETFENKLQLINFSVANELRRRGIGTQMIKRVQNFFMKKDRRTLFTEVNERNLSCQLFLQKNGFKAVNIIPYYFGTDSAYIMQYVAAIKR